MTTGSGPSAPADCVWWGWGTVAAHRPLPPELLRLLAQLLDIDGAPGHPDRPPHPPPSRLTPSLVDALTAVVGPANVTQDDADRIAHCRGKSTSDLLRIRRGDVAGAPDAVVHPASHDEVVELLRMCAGQRIAVVPFGGGTSVVGGLEPDGDGHAGTVAVDLRRLDAIVEIDTVSMTATLQAGLRAVAAESALGRHGLTLGHVPQSFEHASIGGFAATRSSGQASAGYGRFDQMVVGLVVATPVGTWRLGRAPASAAGPDLRQVVLGSEGAFGITTEVVVAVQHSPERRHYAGWRVPRFGIGIDLVRSLAQHPPGPTMVRLSDEAESAAGLSNVAGPPDQGAGGCHLLLGFEGTAADVAARRHDASRRLAAGGAVLLGDDVGAEWFAGRFRAPYLRDELVAAGGFAETIETATSWSALPTLYRATRAAIIGSMTGPCLVTCHVSHVYRTGASLYFTVIYRPVGDPVAQWNAIKATATDAIMAAGGSLTHHHGVGTVHRPWLAQEIGDVGVGVLAAIKRQLDPTGILNPGVLVERSASDPPSQG